MHKRQRRIFLIVIFSLFLLLSVVFSFLTRLNPNAAREKIRDRLERWFSDSLYFFPFTSGEFGPLSFTEKDVRDNLFFRIHGKGRGFLPSCPGFLETAHGIYACKKYTRHGSSYYMLQKIYSDFPVDNEYFYDQAHPFIDFGKPVFSLQTGKHSLTAGGKKIFIRFRQSSHPLLSLLTWTFWIISMTLLWITGQGFPIKRKNQIIYSVRLGLALILFKLLPGTFYEHVLYDKPLYHFYSFFTLYNGDLMILLLVLTLEAMGLRMEKMPKNSEILSYLSGGLIALILFPLSFLLIHYSGNLFLPHRFSEFEAVPALMLFFCWTSLSLWMLLLTGSLHRIQKQKITGMIICVLLFLPLYAGFKYWTGLSLIASVIVALFFSGCTVIALFLRNEPLRGLVVFLGVTSILSIMILHSNRKKAMDRMKAFAQHILQNRDETLEAEFLEVPERILQDKSVLNLIDLAPGEEMIPLLKKNIFYGYFRRYQLFFNLFDKNCMPLWKNDIYILSNLDALQGLVEKEGNSTLSDYLHHITLPDHTSFYLGLIPVKDKTLAIQFLPMPVGESGTVFDLFSEDDSRQLLKKSACEGYAIYHHSLLSEKYGLEEVPYHLNPVISSILYDRYDFFQGENKIMFFKIPSSGWSSLLRILLSLLALHGFLFAAFAYGLYFLIGPEKKRHIGFRERMLLYFFTSLIILLGISFAFLYSGIYRQFDVHIRQQLTGHYHTLKKSVSALIPEDLNFEYIRDPLDYALKKFSFENNMDVIFYDTSGVQHLSTLEKLNLFGIRDYVIPENILKTLQKENRSQLVTEEKAGKLIYPCLYGPVFNPSGRKVGYVAMPFFPSRMEIFRQLDELVNSAVNVFILFTLSALVLTFVLSGYILRPLRMLASRLRSDKPVWETAPLEWKSEDEIRLLVDAYNTMLVQLKENIRKLSEQERESAWREMARQIAHEIKNPLTPIKLNLQHLIYLRTHHPSEFENKFKSSFEAIMQQIDALAAIAGEFSHFARISEEPFETLDLKECVYTVARLYENGPLQIHLKIPENPVMIQGNKNQIISVFNNLMENSRQAMEHQVNPCVTITMTVSHHEVKITFQDNGPGIPEEIKEKLFMPYFTTKSSGSGLGLAISRRIMQHHRGNIELLSSTQGACFQLVFPMQKGSSFSENTF